MAFIGLAAPRVIGKHVGDTKFCFGVDCNKEVDKKDFPKSGGRYCKRCASMNLLKKIEQKKNNIQFF